MARSTGERNGGGRNQREWSTFNAHRQLKLNLGGRKERVHLRDLLDGKVPRRIAVAAHCYGCTAGQGSSCGGALATVDAGMLKQSSHGCAV